MNIKINGPKLNAFLSSDKNTGYMKDIVSNLINLHLGLDATNLSPGQRNKGYQLLIDLKVAEELPLESQPTNQVNS